MPSSRFAVASSPVPEHEAMSPAPTSTSDDDGGGGGGATFVIVAVVVTGRLFTPYRSVTMSVTK
jgi:hypothetical protein